MVVNDGLFMGMGRARRVALRLVLKILYSSPTLRFAMTMNCLLGNNVSSSIFSPQTMVSLLDSGAP